MLNGQALSPVTASCCADGAFSPLFNLRKGGEKHGNFFPFFFLAVRPLAASFFCFSFFEDMICDGHREENTEQGATLL